MNTLTNEEKQVKEATQLKKKISDILLLHSWVEPSPELK